MNSEKENKGLSEAFLVEQLKKIVTDYSVFCEIATKLNWIPIEEKHCAWFSYPLGLDMDAYKFLDGYVEKNFSECYVRSILSGMINAEEWESDTFDISAEERKEYFTKGQKLYEMYLTYRDLRLKVISVEQLQKQIMSYAEDIDASCQMNQNTVYHASDNVVDRQELKYFEEYIENSIVIEIGGGYGGDYTYLAVKQDSLLVVDCGIWD